MIIIKDKPVIKELPICMYNFTSDNLENQPSCSHLLPPWNSDAETFDTRVTKQDFAECISNLSLVLCNTELLCYDNMQLSCSLQLCLVAANSNTLPNTKSLEIYTTCFTVVFDNLPDRRVTAIQTVREWVRYCLNQTENYQTCLMEFTSLCFSAQLPLTPEDCITFLPVLCGNIGNNTSLRKQCKADIDGTISAVLVGQCSQPESQPICVSQYEVVDE